MPLVNQLANNGVQAQPGLASARCLTQKIASAQSPHPIPPHQAGRVRCNRIAPIPEYYITHAPRPAPAISEKNSKARRDVDLAV